MKNIKSKHKIEKKKNLPLAPKIEAKIQCSYDYKVTKIKEQKNDT